MVLRGLANKTFLLRYSFVICLWNKNKIYLLHFYACNFTEHLPTYQVYDNVLPLLQIILGHPRSTKNCGVWCWKYKYLIAEYMWEAQLESQNIHIH